MIDPDETPTPALGPCCTLAVSLAPETVIGTLATGGIRAYRAATGGTIEGSDLRGDIIGGGEMLLGRPDGVGVVEANYLLRTSGGGIIRLIGTGYATSDPPFIGTRMTVVFEVDEGGPIAHLSTRAYVAERSAGSDRYAIAEVL